jgi:hypothetical protein
MCYLDRTVGSSAPRDSRAFKEADLGSLRGLIGSNRALTRKNIQGGCNFSHISLGVAFYFETIDRHFGITVQITL